MEENSKKGVVNHFEAGSNCQVFNGPISGCVFAMPGSNVTQNSHGTVPSESTSDGQPDVPTLVACVSQVREYLWSDSSMAVIFCVCRDCYGYVNNMSQFERDFRCSVGLLASTFQNNPYMRLNIGRWEKNGVKARVQRLVEAYKNAVTERLRT